jgi:hypothetical protein
VDIYEGMPHVHQFLYKTPESKIALSPKRIEFKQAKDELNEFIRVAIPFYRRRANCFSFGIKSKFAVKVFRLTAI